MLYKQTQLGVFRSDEGRPCEQTNPIPALTSIPRSAFPGGRILPNKANWPPEGVGRGRPTHEEPRGQSCETKPNLGELGCLGDRTGGQVQGKCAKQTQLAAERPGGQVLYGQGVMVNWTSKGLRRSKANSRRCRGDGVSAAGDEGNRAKQSQFPGTGPTGWSAVQTDPIPAPYADPKIGAPGRTNPAKRSQFPPGRPPAGACPAKQSQFASGTRKTIANLRRLRLTLPPRQSLRLCVHPGRAIPLPGRPSWSRLLLRPGRHEGPHEYE
jgi:hypothetical protein